MENGGYLLLILFGPGLVLAVIFQVLLIIKFLKIKANHLNYTISSNLYSLFIVFLVLFIISLLYLLLTIFSVGSSTAGPEVAIVPLLFGGLTLAAMSVTGYFSVITNNIPEINQNSVSKGKFIKGLTISIDLLLIALIFLSIFISNSIDKKDGSDKLTQEQAVEIAKKDFNPGVKYELYHAEQMPQTENNNNYAWELTFSIFSKRDKFIGYYDTLVDNNEAKIIYKYNHKVKCSLLLNQKPISSSEVILIDTAGSGDSLTGVATDYGITDTNGLINIALGEDNPSKVFVIDQNNVLRSKNVKYDESLQNSCIIDYSNSSTQSPDQLLKFLER